MAENQRRVVDGSNCFRFNGNYSDNTVHGVYMRTLTIFFFFAANEANIVVQLHTA